MYPFIRDAYAFDPSAKKVQVQQGFKRAQVTRTLGGLMTFEFSSRAKERGVLVQGVLGGLRSDI